LQLTIVQREPNVTDIKDFLQKAEKEIAKQDESINLFLEHLRGLAPDILLAVPVDALPNVAPRRPSTFMKPAAAIGTLFIRG
jgi:hypothetical protein